MRTLVLIVLVAAATAVAALAEEAQAPSSGEAPAWVMSGRVPAGQSLVVIHNCSGKSLRAGAYTVSFDGRRVAKLVRGQYTAVLLPPGEHLGWVGSKPPQSFATRTDGVTHWAVANAPGKNWIAPFGDQPFAFGVVADSLGRLMMREHKWTEPLVPLPVVDVPDSARAAGIF
jgi:hypothetical protein